MDNDETLKRKVVEIQKSFDAYSRQLEKDMYISDALFIRKSNWQEIQRLLERNNITTIYHYTDRSNIKSIIEFNGLFSWIYLEESENIPLPMHSRATEDYPNAFNLGVENFINLSFVKDHPGMHIAVREKRINDPVILNISLEVCYWENTKFTTMNYADRKSMIGNGIHILENCRFDLFNRNYLNLIEDERKFYQAEVLVKTWIPLEYISNIGEINY